MSIAQIRQALAAQHQSPELDQLWEAVQRATSTMRHEDAARTWLSAAEVWFKDDVAIRARAWDEAASRAWNRREIFDIIDDSAARAANLQAIIATSSIRANLGASQPERSVALKRLADAANQSGDVNRALAAIEALIASDSSEHAFALDWLQSVARSNPAAAAAAQRLSEQTVRQGGDAGALFALVSERVLNDAGSDYAAAKTNVLEALELSDRTAAAPELPLQLVDGVSRRYPADAADLLRSVGPWLNRARRSLAIIRWARNAAVVAGDRALWLELTVNELDSTNEPASRARLNLELASEHLALGQIGDAARHARTAISEDAGAREQALDLLDAALAASTGETRIYVEDARLGALRAGADSTRIHQALRDRVRAAAGSSAGQSAALELAEFECEQRLSFDLASLIPMLSSADLAARAEHLLRSRLPDSVACSALADYYRAQNRQAELVEVLRAWATSEPADQKRAEISFELGNLLEATNSAEAIGEFSSAAELAPDNLEYSSRLRHALELAGRFQDALALLGRLAERSASSGNADAAVALELDRLSLLDRQGATLSERIEETWLASQRHKSSVVLSDYLSKLFGSDRTGRSVLEAALAFDSKRTADPAEFLHHVWHSLTARVAAGREAALALASRGWLRGADTEPLEFALAENGENDKLLGLYIALLTQHQTDEVRAETLRRASVLLMVFKRVGEAQAYLLDAVRCAPGRVQLWRSLAEAARSASDVATTAWALENVLALEPGDAGAEVAMREELLEHYAVALARPDLAIQTAQRIVALAPMHGQAVDFVRSYAAGSGQFRMLYDVLAGSREAIESQAERVDRELELADIAELQLGDKALAASHQQWLSEHESVATAVRLLALRWLQERAFEANSTAAVVELFAREAEITEDEALADRTEQTVERLLDLGDWRSANTLLGATLDSRDASSAMLLDRRAELARRSGDLGVAKRALLDWDLKFPPLPVDRRAALTELLFADSADDADAWKHAELVLAQDLEHSAVRAAVLQHAASAAAANFLPQLLSAQAELAAEERLTLLRFAAEFSHQRQDADAAESFLREILAVAPEDREAREHLRSSLQARENSLGQIELLRQDLAALGESESPSPLLRQILALSPAADAETVLGELLDADYGDVDARKQLIDLYRGREDRTELIDSLNELAEFLEGDERDLVLLEAADEAEAIGDLGKTAASLEKVVASRSGADPLWDRFIQIQQRRELPSALAAALERRAAATTDDDERVRLLHEAAKIHGSGGSNVDAAIAALESVLKTEPANLPVLEEIARLQEASERWEDQLATFDRMATVASVPALADEVRLRAGRLLLEKLERPADAAGLATAVISAQGPDADAIQLLRDACAATGDTAALASGLAVAAKASEEPAREALELEVAQLLEAIPDSHGKAISYLISCVQQQPRLGARLELLETLAATHNSRRSLGDLYAQFIRNADTDDASYWHAVNQSVLISSEDFGQPATAFGIVALACTRPTVRDQAVLLLKSVAEKNQLWAEYRSWLTEQSDAAETDADATGWLLERALIEREHLGDWEAAFETYVAAYQLEPLTERVSKPLYEVAARQNVWPYVLSLLELLQKSAEPEMVVQLRIEMANIYATYLGDFKQSFAQHLRAWQLDPLDEQLRESLAARATQTNSLPELLTAFEWLAKQETEEPAEKIAATRRAAVLAAKLGNEARVVSHFSALLELEGHDSGPALAAEIRDLDGAPPALVVRAIAAVSDVCTNASGASAMRVVAADVCQKLGDLAGEAALLEAALPGAENEEALVERLRANYTGRQEWAGLAALLARLAESSDAAKSVAALRELRELFLVSGGDEDAAAEISARIAALPADGFEYQDEHRAFLRRIEKWPALVDVLSAAAENAPADRRATLLDEAVTVCLDQLDDGKRALRLTDSLLETDADSVTGLRARSRALLALEKWRDAAETLERLSTLQTGAELISTLTSSAEIAEENLFDTERALVFWRKVAEVDATSSRARLHIARLLAEKSDIDGARMEYSAAVSALREAEDKSALADALYHLAALEFRSDSSFDSRAILQEAVTACPSHGAARHALETLLTEKRDFEAVLALLDSEFDESADDHSRALCLGKRARVLFFSLDREADAKRALERSLEYSSDNRTIRLLEADIALAREQWSAAASAYGQALAQDEFPSPILDTPPILAAEPASGAANVRYPTRFGHALEKVGKLQDSQDKYAAANIEDDLYAPALLGLSRLAVARGHKDAVSVYLAALREQALDNQVISQEIAQVERRLSLL